MFIRFIFSHGCCFAMFCLIKLLSDGILFLGYGPLTGCNFTNENHTLLCMSAIGNRQYAKKV